MGLFGMIGDVLGTLHDMKELGKIQDGIEEAVEAPYLEYGICSRGWGFFNRKRFFCKLGLDKLMPRRYNTIQIAIRYLA